MMKRFGLMAAAVLATAAMLNATAMARQTVRGATDGDRAEIDQRVTVRFASVKQPQAMPMPVADPLATGAVMPGCAAPVAPCAPTPCVCCPTPCITYRHAALDLSRLCRPKCCKPPVQLVLATKNPCTCCPVDVPVCLPGCCCGEPTVDCRKTLIGEGLVTYEWCCGVSVSIRYKKCGDVLVTYRGV